MANALGPFDRAAISTSGGSSNTRRQAFCFQNTDQSDPEQDHTNANAIHLTQFHQILRDAEVANSIAPIVRKHRLTEEETTKALLRLRVPRAANVARIAFR